jgi:hypothetical protein
MTHGERLFAAAFLIALIPNLPNAMGKAIPVLEHAIALLHGRPGDVAANVTVLLVLFGAATYRDWLQRTGFVLTVAVTLLRIVPHS